jgi:hypothetical protein
MTSSTGCSLCLAAVVAAFSPLEPQRAGADLFTRVGLTAEDADAARSGQRVVRVLPSDVDTEIAVAGAIRIKGDLERLAAWLRDVEQFRRSLGDDAVGVIGNPARAENFSGLPADEAQQLVAYAAAYQRGGDAALGAARDPKNPQALADEFQDMHRRAAKVWQLAYPFAVYLEEFPAKRPAGVEDRFYWTRETGKRSPVLTLHHVVLERLPDTSLRLADKQFYASRDIDAALLVGQATPAANGGFDLVIALRARTPKLGSAAARLLRDRVSREVADSFGLYLDWLKQSFALG